MFFPSAELDFPSIHSTSRIVVYSSYVCNFITVQHSSDRFSALFFVYMI